MTITVQDVVDQVRALAKEHPHFIYTSQEHASGACSYVYAARGFTSGVGCIVGQALERAGVPRQVLLEHDNIGPAQHMIDYLVYEGHITDLAPHNYERTVQWLYDVQRNQDRGDEWELAVSTADNLATFE